jgi:hypothetical protein
MCVTQKLTVTHTDTLKSVPSFENPVKKLSYFKICLCRIPKQTKPLTPVQEFCFRTRTAQNTLNPMLNAMLHGTLQCVYTNESKC